jgi:hypothetical protein
MSNSRTDSNVTLWSILAVYGTATAGAVFAYLLTAVLIGLLDGLAIEVPAWYGSAAVTAPVWVALLLWLPDRAGSRRILAVIVVALATAPLVPVDASWVTRLSLSSMASLGHVPTMWFWSRSRDWAKIGDPLEILLLLIAMPVIGLSAIDLAESDLVATWSLTLALVLSAGLVVITAVAIDRPRWRSKGGWYLQAGTALLAALAILGFAGLMLPD